MTLENHTNHMDGIKKLAIEMIASALAELKKKDVRHVEEALLWFDERSSIVGGYGWCLIVSGGNPNVIRTNINKLLKKRLNRKDGCK